MSKEFEELVLKELRELKNDNKSVLKELKDFKKETINRFNTLEGRVTIIENDVKDFRKETTKRFDETDKRFDETDKRFDETDKRFDETDKRFNSLERTVTIIEDEVKNKIPALFDSDLTRRQKENSLQSEVDHLRQCISKSFNKNFSSRD